MPMPGRYQLQITPAEMTTILAALHFMKESHKAARISDIEMMVLNDTIRHLERGKLH